MSRKTANRRRAAQRSGADKQLNEQQRTAATHGDNPLLIIAGAGSGKTHTLLHRVAHLIDSGVDPSRILLLTFTRRAAAAMLRRVEALLRSRGRRAGSRIGSVGSNVWGGTFHAMATRLLRMHGKAIGLPPDFTIHDRSDSEDLLDVVRTQMELPKFKKRFPRKATCMAIYSHCVNSQLPMEEVLGRHFTWCAEYQPQLKEMFQAYVDSKEQGAVLDYDDLLLFWHGLLADEDVGHRVRERFDRVLVDEYQDTNRLQSDILKLLRPEGKGLTVVGDDAQSIYSFRAATVRNILEFPEEFPGTVVVKLEQNYRSTQPILEATNTVIAQARERFTKNLWSDRAGGERPHLITCRDDSEQSDAVIRQILEHREGGIQLRHQAVLFRASHHSMFLEAALAEHNIPFVKYGGLKFTETAHIKDLMAFLRLAENPRDLIAGQRLLTLLPGIGPRTAHRLMEYLMEEGGDFESWRNVNVPKACLEDWPELVELFEQLCSSKPPPLPAQIHAVLDFYTPLLEEKHDNAASRMRDLEQFEHLSARFPDRLAMITDIALDPPASTEDYAGPPMIDEDYLILSTIHSAKGLEYDCVYVIGAADGNIPSDMSTGDPEEIDEELRLFYVALTRAKNWLYVYFPERFYYANRGVRRDRYGLAKRTRFLPNEILQLFENRVAGVIEEELDMAAAADKRQGIRKSVRF